MKGPWIGLLALGGGLTIACAPVPRPLILTDAERVSQGAASTEAHTYAPGAYAHAEKLRKDADAAFAAGDTSGAQLLGERAIAAYAHAQALARIARAESGTDQAEGKLSASKAELAGLDAEQIRIAAEADALELKVRIARDTQPIQPSAKGSPEREQARLAAARSLALQARLLCAGARLLASGGAAGSAGSPPSPAPDPRLGAQVDEATTALAKVDAQLGAGAIAAPIDEATRARAACLGALTMIRRAATPVSRAPGAGDALLAEISATGSFSPSRDDRGVYITLRGLFNEGRGGAGGPPSLTPAAEARLAEIGKIAAAHPAFPVEIVLHHDKTPTAKDEPALRARADAVARAIAGVGRGVRTEPILAGNAAPVVDPAGADKARNARVEIVFVTPESF